jgi:hypothetical protein
MTGEEKKPEESPAEPDGGEEPPPGAPESAFTSLVKEAVKALVPIFITGASLIGFVAFAGAVIVWTRLYAIEVPPEQAVKAVPRDELVATGSSLLLIFGFFGVLTVVGSYLIDRGGRATPGMARGLLALFAIEGVIAIRMFDDAWHPMTFIAVGLFILTVLIAIAATFREHIAKYLDVLPARPEEILCAERGPGVLRTAAGQPRVDGWLLAVAAVSASATVGALIALVLVDFPSWFRYLLWIQLGGAAVATAWLCWRIGGAIVASWTTERRTSGRTRPQGGVTPPAETAEIQPGIRSEAPRPGEDEFQRAERLARERRVEEQRLRREAEAKRLRRHRPHRLVITPAGIGVFLFLAAFALLVPWALIGEPLLVVPLAAAMVLGIGVWRIAVLSKLVFMWFGLAVFISVPLFGTFALMTRNFADPQVQPVAIIRATDGPDESIQGIYVTEGDDRVYFANVATEGCKDDVKPDSGRLLWVPKSEVVAMSIGPAQDVDDAGRAALEMAYALTPSVETPAGDHVSLSAPEQRFEGEAVPQGAPATPSSEGGEAGEEAPDGGATGATGVTGATGRREPRKRPAVSTSVSPTPGPPCGPISARA